MLKRFEKDFRRYFQFSVILAKSQLKSEVANSYLNWIWWILDPISFMMIYVFVFGYVFKSREPFFAVFIFIGLTMWTFFNRTITGSIKIVKRNKGLVSKVYFPKYILLLTEIWVNGFKMMISFGVVILLMVIYRVPISVNVIYFFPCLLVLVMLTFGCSCYMLHYGVYVEDLSNVMKIVLRLVFYLTGIFYNVEAKIPEYGALFGRLNPMAFLITSMRQCLIYESVPARKILVAWAVVGLLLAIFGVRKIYKEENSYVKAI